MPPADSEPTRDEALAREIAEFIADRAFEFKHHECRAWALSDFKAWAEIAGLEPVLGLLESPETGDDSGSEY